MIYVLRSSAHLYMKLTNIVVSHLTSGINYSVKYMVVLYCNFKQRSLNASAAEVLLFHFSAWIIQRKSSIDTVLYFQLMFEVEFVFWLPE